MDKKIKPAYGLVFNQRGDYRGEKPAPRREGTNDLAEVAKSSPPVAVNVVKREGVYYDDKLKKWVM